MAELSVFVCFFFQAEDGIRDSSVTGVQTCALPIFISFRCLDWREARLEDAGEFVAWLRLPPAGRSGEVAVLPTAAAEVRAATVNRKLAPVIAFDAHQARNGAAGRGLVPACRRGSRGG